MEIAATVTSKGQITLPKAVRDALSVHEGDRVVFRVPTNQAVLARSPSPLDLASNVPVPVQARGASWPDIRRRARQQLDRR